MCFWDGVWRVCLSLIIKNIHCLAKKKSFRFKSANFFLLLWSGVASVGQGYATAFQFSECTEWPGLHWMDPINGFFSFLMARTNFQDGQCQDFSHMNWPPQSPWLYPIKSILECAGMGLSCHQYKNLGQKMNAMEKDGNKCLWLCLRLSKTMLQQNTFP